MISYPSKEQNILIREQPPIVRILGGVMTT